MGQTVVLKDICLANNSKQLLRGFWGQGTQTQITDICDVNMEESCKFPAFCAEAQMLQAGLAPEGRAALGDGCCRSAGFTFSICSTNSFFASYREKATCRRSALSVRKDWVSNYLLCIVLEGM